MSSENQSDLRVRYYAAFIFPFAKHSWKSRRARSCWVDLEGWQDALAGPLSSIIDNGDCAYVYARNDNFISGINDPTELYAWLKHRHSKLIEDLDRFVPASQDEESDLASMRQFTSEMWDIAEQAVEIERTRWDAADAKNR